MRKNPKRAIKQAPVASLTTIESVIGFGLTFLVSHGMIGSIDVGATTQTVAPFVALLLPAIFGTAKWHLVSPVEKVDDIVARDGVISDADIGRIDAMLADRVVGLLRSDHLDEQPRHQLRPHGMAAGHPLHSGAA